MVTLYDVVKPAPNSTASYPTRTYKTIYRPIATASGVTEYEAYAIATATDLGEKPIVLDYSSTWHCMVSIPLDR